MTGRVRTIAVFMALTVVLVLAAAFLLDKVQTSREVENRTEAPPPSVVTVQVSRERLVETETRPCRIRPRRESAVPIATTVGDPVVTGVPAGSGSSVSEGAVVLEVSGRPIIVLQGVLPPYRDLKVGDIGPDVDQLKESLVRLGLLTSSDLAAPKVSGATVQAVRALYEGSGYEPPRGSGVVVPRQEILPVALLPAVVELHGTQVGDVGEAARPALASTEKVAECELTHQEAEALQRSASSRLAVAGKTFEVSVDRVLQATDAAESGQVRVVLNIRDAGRLRAGGGAAVRYRTAASPHAGLVVPVSALWRMSDGADAVSVVSSGKKRAVPVRVTYQGSTAAVVKPVTSGGLAEGDEVVVSGAL